MWRKLKYKLFKKRVRKHLLTEERNKRFVNYDKAQTVFLLFESHYTEKNPELKQIVHQLNADGKKVVAWGYVEKKELMTPAYPDFRILHQKQFSMMDKPSSDIMQDLMAQEFDLLIDITIESYLPVDYLVLYANAKCKVGMRKGEVNLYDFSIQLDHFMQEKELEADDLEIDFLYEQIKYYLKSIQTKD